MTETLQVNLKAARQAYLRGERDAAVTDLINPDAASLLVDRFLPHKEIDSGSIHSLWGQVCG